MKKIKYLVLLLSSVSMFSCSTPGDAVVEPPAELITHVLLTLKDSANMTDSVVARFADIDGPSGSGVPVITGVTLKRGRTYIGSIRFLQVIPDQNDTVIEVTDEVRELSTQHQVFYKLSNQLQPYMSVSVTDNDASGLPLGLATVVGSIELNTPISGKLNVVLSHYEQAGSKNGTDRSDESDVDIDFPIVLE